MLSLVTAAEYQHRQESLARDRDQALIVAMRERASAQRTTALRTTALRTPASPPVTATAARPVHAPAPRRRAAWARPIGLAHDAPCAPACAPA